MTSPEALLGTASGLYRVPGGSSGHFGGEDVTAVGHGHTRWWALVDRCQLWHGGPSGEVWERVADLEGVEGRCLLPTADGVLVGTSEARLLRLAGQAMEPVTSFDDAPGRDTWYTPWGGPPDTRWLAQGSDGSLYAHVHVGGILRSDDGGETWTPTIDVDADVHQVVAGEELLAAATAVGLAVSEDRGDTWAFHHAGLHAPYCRAVALTADGALVTASTGPSSREAAVYRWDGDRLGKAHDGLPEWFPANLDTGWLAAGGHGAFLAAPDGSLYRSEDAGGSWTVAAHGLPPPRCLALERTGEPPAAH